jgi:hypothetical protein
MEIRAYLVYLPLDFYVDNAVFILFDYSSPECFSFCVPTYERPQIFIYQDIQIEREYEELLRGPPRQSECQHL